jgi:hypothetical protein
MYNFMIVTKHLSNYVIYIILNSTNQRIRKLYNKITLIINLHFSISIFVNFVLIWLDKCTFGRFCVIKFHNLLKSKTLFIMLGFSKR